MLKVYTYFVLFNLNLPVCMYIYSLIRPKVVEMKTLDREQSILTRFRYLFYVGREMNEKSGLKIDAHQDTLGTVLYCNNYV